MSYLCGRDLGIIEALVYQPNLKPSYEAVKGVLTWRDEWSFELSQEGLEKIYKLWIARSYIHNGIPFPSYSRLNPDLAFATSEKRAVITENRKDFFLLVPRLCLGTHACEALPRLLQQHGRQSLRICITRHSLVTSKHE
jgi:hypothetical protein